MLASLWHSRIRDDARPREKERVNMKWKVSVWAVGSSTRPLDRFWDRFG